MADVNRTVLITEEQDQFVTGVMQRRGWSRSQVIRLAIEKLRSGPVILLGADSNDVAISEPPSAYAEASA
jgi:hypothetical protein